MFGKGRKAEATSLLPQFNTTVVATSSQDSCCRIPSQAACLMEEARLVKDETLGFPLPDDELPKLLDS